MASVNKRKRINADGSNGDKWIVRYIDPGGVHRQATYDRRKDADAFRAQVENDARKGMLAPDATRITMGSTIEAYLDQLEQRRRGGSIGETYRHNVETLLRRHAMPFLQNRKLAEINLAVLSQWHRDMVVKGRLAPYSGRMIVRMISSVIKHAMRHEWMHRNPAALLLEDLRGLAAGKVRTFSIEETQHVLRAANEKMYRGCRPDAHLRLQCVVHLAAFCGLRLGEIFGLRLEDIDIAARQLNIRKSLSRREGVKRPKSQAGVRLIAVPDHVVVLLSAWVERYQFANAGGALFRASDGRAISMDGFRRGSWGALLDRAGFPRDGDRPAFRLHALRHFAASWMIDAGWTLPEVAKTLGHAKVDMTLSVYAHALSHKATSQPQMQALADRLLTQEPAHQLRMSA